MWTPTQLIHSDVVETLRQSGFKEEFIQFLGWMSGTASAVNNSKNPAKAASTLLGKPSLTPMLEKFFKRKTDSLAGRSHGYRAAEGLLDDFQEQVREAERARTYDDSFKVNEDRISDWAADSPEQAELDNE